MTVEDGTVVEHEHRVLDVVRWAEIVVDGEDAEGEEELIGRVRQAMQEALMDGGDRLLALRVGVEGATKLDDRLRADPDRWRSQVQAVGAELGVEKVWVEKVQLRTKWRRAVR